ncbi:hemerythrin domain-containing protein [Nocardia sp. BSTN01]|uniref:hemerythrin domain-containing protein n=1 Tax=Nocardia sp. BSTN01 TaxID=2783665 RepID=UPI00188E0785|nr:hemerythrin domain-containing protein [Nocardia sp. BSTN01]MBF4998745.1 hemerythrin domain-containing protein [Nocardia sp. BSTN01]
MDALTFLRNDHESVLGMLESLERGRGTGEAEVKARGDLVTSLVMAESQHEAIEEQFFWPAVRRALPDGDNLADRAVSQEDSAKELLQQLEDFGAGSREFEEALDRFIPAARAHIEFEQSQVWPRLSEAQSPAELEQLGDKMQAAKKFAPTRPHPNTPSNPATLKSAGLLAAVLDKVRDFVGGRRAHQPPTPPPT